MSHEASNVEPKALKLFDVIEYTLSDNKTRRAVVVQPEGEAALGVCEIIVQPDGTFRLGFGGSLPDGQAVEIVDVWTPEQIEEGLMNTNRDALMTPFGIDREHELRASIRHDLGKIVTKQSIDS